MLMMMMTTKKMPRYTDSILDIHLLIAVHWSGWLIAMRTTKTDEQGLVFPIFSSLFSCTDNERQPKSIIVICINIYKHSDKSMFSFSLHHRCHYQPLFDYLKAMNIRFLLTTFHIINAVCTSQSMLIRHGCDLLAITYSTCHQSLNRWVLTK